MISEMIFSRVKNVQSFWTESDTWRSIYALNKIIHRLLIEVEPLEKIKIDPHFGDEEDVDTLSSQVSLHGIH